MRNPLVIIAAVFAVIAGIATFVAQSNRDDAHYLADEIASLAQAKTTLQTTMEQIRPLVAQTQTQATRADAMELIHEHSYTLEEVSDYLSDKQLGQAGLRDDFDEAVQAIHYASEQGAHGEVPRWFARLQNMQSPIMQLSESQTYAGKTNKDIYHIAIKNHRFTPEEVVVPSGKRIKLLIDNQDASVEEFESHDLKREKIIAGNSKATIFVGPLKKGRYHFFGEFNMATANGYLIAQ